MVLNNNLHGTALPANLVPLKLLNSVEKISNQALKWQDKENTLIEEQTRHLSA